MIHSYFSNYIIFFIIIFIKTLYYFWRSDCFEQGNAVQDGLAADEVILEIQGKMAGERASGGGDCPEPGAGLYAGYAQPVE